MKKSLRKSIARRNKKYAKALEEQAKTEIDLNVAALFTSESIIYLKIWTALWQRSLIFSALQVRIPNPLLLKNISIFKVPLTASGIPMKGLDEEGISNSNKEELDKVNDQKRLKKKRVYKI